MKRLEKGRFSWPRTADASGREITEQLQMLLAGIDFWSAHQELNYTEDA